MIGMLLHERSTLEKLSVTHNIISHPHAGAQSSQPQSSAPSYAPEKLSSMSFKGIGNG